MEEELGGTFVVSVDELGLNGLWSTIQNLVESRMPLQSLTLPNKVGKPVVVPRLPLAFVLCSDKRLLHLKQYSHSPVTWFRNPMTHLVLVSTADVHEYKSTTRAHIKRVTGDIEKDWGGGSVGSEWLILYVRPFELEASDRGAKKVFEKLCDDFGSKRRERVVRLDVPLRAFDGPASSMSSRPGSSWLTAAGTFVGPGGTALTAGLDDLCAGLRDSVRAAFEARKMAYDAEVRKLHNDRRDPGWSFTMLYLVKDSFALMLEGAGLWEDAFQEYVELETVYLDCLEAAAQGSVHSGGVGSHTDFGVSGRDQEDVATLLTSSWRKMRSLVLQKRNVQEFQFRQYLFAAQARVLLRLNRPVDVAERGLVFVQNFLGLLAAKEAAGQLKPWLKECWTFSACMSLITAITTFMQRHHELPTDWDIVDLVPPGGPSTSAAQAALRSLTAAAAAAAAYESSAGTASHGFTSSITSCITSSSASSASAPALPAAAWQLGAVDADVGFDVSGSGAAAAAAADEDVPPLDLALLCGRAILPGNVGLLMQEGEQRRELIDKLYCCLVGHLYHLARGELLRLGSALQLPEAAAANASVLQLGKAAFTPAKPALAAAAAGSKSPHSQQPGGSSSSSSPVKQSQGSTAGQTLGQTAAEKGGKSSLTAGIDLLLQASASGALSPRMVSQLQELLMTPLCGFSMMINKYADGSSSGLTYEVHTPRLEQDPLASALHRADSQSTPYNSNATGQLAASAAAAATSSPRIGTPGAAGSTASPFGRGSSSAAATPTGQAAVSSTASSMLDRLRRVGSNSGSIIASGGSSPVAAAAGQQQQQQQGGQHSRLSKVTGEFESESDASLTAQSNMGSSMQRQDSSTSLATVNIGGGTSADGGASFNLGRSSCQTGDDIIDDISLSGASVTYGSAAAAAVAAADAASTADSASSYGTGQSMQARASHVRTQSALEGTAAHAGLLQGHQQDAPSLPKVASHARSASAGPVNGILPAAGAAAGGAAGSAWGPQQQQQEAAPPEKGLRARRQAPLAALQPTAATAAAAAAVPSWVGEWRLQLALRSPLYFQELVLALSRHAAWCYAKAGRVRSSALIYADVAVLALQRGQLDAAASLLDRMHHIFAAEGWQQLLGVLLPKLLACQSLAAQPMLPFTALRLLALKPGATAAADRQAAFEELLTVVGASPTGAAAAGQQGVPAGAGSSSTVQLATLSAIQMRPAPGTYSHFFGHEAFEAFDAAPSSSSSSRGASAAGAIGSSSSSGHGSIEQLVPVLSPPAQSVVASASSSSSRSQADTTCLASATACTGSNQQQQQQQHEQQHKAGGAALLVVGDSLSLAVDVTSSLPAPVLLQRPLLSLVQLHKSTWISSATSGINGALLGPDASGFGRRGSGIGSGFSPKSAGGVYRSPAKGFKPSQGGAGPQGFSAVWDAIGGDKGMSHHDSPRNQSVRWQEGDELVATKLLAAFSPSSSSSSNAGGGSGSTTDGSSSVSSGCRLLPDGSVLLAPGVNRLVFRVAPVQPGLYCLKQLRALLGTCGELIIGLPPPGSLSLLAAAANLGSSSSSSRPSRQVGSSGGAAVTPDPAELPAVAGGAGGSDVVQMGGVTSAGAVVSEVVVARVMDPAPRVRMEPVVPEGSLPIGTTAWLGLLVTPLQGHSLTRPRLHLQPNSHITLAAAVAPGLGGSMQQQQQQMVGLGPVSSTASADQQQQQQQQHMLLGGASTSGLTAASTSSGSVGTHPQQQQQQQLGHFVYVTPLQQQQQQQQQGDQQEQQQQQAVTEVAGTISHQPHGQWLQLRRGCVDLSELSLPGGVLDSPLLVWMQVVVGCPRSPQATIPVASLSPPPHSQPTAAHAGPPGSQQGASPTAAAAAAAAAAGVWPKVSPEPCVLLAGRAQEAVADMLLQLEYTADAGVWRSHASSLQLPLQQPVNLSATALQLPSGAVAISITLSLDPDLRTAFVLHQAGLRPHFGLLLGPGFSSSSSSSSEVQGQEGPGGEGLGGSRVGFSEAVPLVVVPGGTAGLSFLLLPDPGDKLTGSFEVDGCNLLLLSYSVVPYSSTTDVTDPYTGQLLPQPPALPDAAAAAGGAAGTAPVGVADSNSSSHLGHATAAGTASCASILTGSSSSSSSVLNMQLPFWLEFPSVDESSPAAASVQVTLLGPYTGRLGQAVTFSWQLLRIASADAAAAAADSAYSSVPLDSLDSQQQQQGAGTSSSADAAAVGGSSGWQQHSSAESDSELLCYELLFGSMANKHAAAVASDAQGSSQAASSTAAAAAAAAAATAAADIGGLGGTAKAAALWGVTGSAPSGVVRLGRPPGSLAVVEVVLQPRATGQVPVPQLVLKSLGGNQVVLLEGGSGHDSVVSVSK